VILDCSGSMLDQIDGKDKFEIAKDAVRGLLKDMPDNSEVALRAYGYRLRAIQPGANEDTKLLVPLKALDRKEMAGFIDGLRARGKTPLALSLEQAADDLDNAASAERPITAVLLTDGGEDTQPRKDPVAAASAFAKIENVKLHIVGFDINREDWTDQLTKMATAAGGEYLSASKAEQLQQELREAVFATPSGCKVFDDHGKLVQSLPFGQSVDLPPGRYHMETDYAGQHFEQPFFISPAETTSITFDAGAIADAINAEKAAAQPKPAAEPAPQAKPDPKFCKNCGRPLKPGAKFCTNCGAKVER